jgi:hypothetical protein
MCHPCKHKSHHRRRTSQVVQIDFPMFDVRGILSELCIASAAVHFVGQRRSDVRSLREIEEDVAGAG